MIDETVTTETAEWMARRCEKLMAQLAASEQRAAALVEALFEIRDYCAELHEGDDVERLTYRVVGMANGAINEYYAALAAAAPSAGAEGA